MARGVVKLTVSPCLGRLRTGPQVPGGGGRGEDRPGLVVAFEVFVGGVGVGHDAGSGRHGCATGAVDHHRADGDGGVEVAGEVDVTHDPGVGAALHRLELVDDLH